MIWGGIKLFSSLFAQGIRALGNCVKSNEPIVYLHVPQLDNTRLLLIRFIDETGGRKIIFYLLPTLLKTEPWHRNRLLRKFLIFFAEENDEQ